MWKDLALNLASEALGILVTVVIVDRLIKRSELRRWRRVNDLLRARIFRVVDRLLNVLDLTCGGAIFYQFGASSVVGFGLLPSLDYLRVRDTVRAALILSRLRESPSELDTADQILATFEAFPGATQELELLALVGELRDAITVCMSFRAGDTADEDFEVTVSTVADKSVALRRALEQLVARKETVDEYLKRAELRSGSRS